MGFLPDLFNLLSENSQAVTGAGGTGMAFAFYKLLNYFIGRNKVDIVEAESDLAQTKAQLAPLENVTNALLVVVQTSQKQNEAIEKTTLSLADVAQLLQSLKDEQTTFAAKLDDVATIKTDLQEVTTAMNDIQKSTGETGEMMKILIQIRDETIQFRKELELWREYNREKEQEFADKLEDHSKKIATVEKRLTQETPVVSVEKTEPKKETTGKTEIQEVKLTDANKTIGAKTQPIQPPITEEKKEDKNNG